MKKALFNGPYFSKHGILKIFLLEGLGKHAGDYLNRLVIQRT
jgi:hypothetical protein